MLSFVTVSPVITAFHSCCQSRHVVRKTTKKKNLPRGGYKSTIKLKFRLRSLISKKKKKKEKKRISNKDNYKFGTDPTMQDQIRTKDWIYKTKKSNLERLSGPVAQRIEALSLYVFR